jgi:hypothetical protein
LVFKEVTEIETVFWLGMSVSLSLCDTVRMAEFEAIVTASFDKIGSQVVALDNIQVPPTTRHPRPLLTESSTRRSAFSFLRKVKSHATSLFLSTTRQHVSVPPPSFVPPLPTRAATPVPFPRTRAPGPKNSFFDDQDEDDNDIDNVHSPVFPQTHHSRRIASAPGVRPNSSYLDSAFTAAPVLFDFPSSSASTSCSVAEHHGILGPDSRARLARVCARSFPDLLPPHVFIL